LRVLSTSLADGGMIEGSRRGIGLACLFMLPTIFAPAIAKDGSPDQSRVDSSAMSLLYLINARTPISFPAHRTARFWRFQTSRRFQ
jgi:hypothetical protein